VINCDGFCAEVLSRKNRLNSEFLEVRWTYVLILGDSQIPLYSVG